MSTAAAAAYAKPDVLVSTEWLAAHLNDPQVRVVESNEDTLLYASGHIPGAAHVDWTADLNDQLRRDYIDKSGFEALLSRIGATPIRLRTAGCRGEPRPPTSTVPASGASRPTAMCTVVLLPAPFGPSSPKTSPFPTVSERPSTAVCEPYRFTSPVSVSMVDGTER